MANSAVPMISNTIRRSSRRDPSAESSQSVAIRSVFFLAIRHFALLLLTGAIFLACENGPPGLVESEAGGSVYLAGSVGNVGCYWMDGALHPLNDADAPIRSIVVHDSRLYLVGSSGDRACCWEGGVRIALPSKAMLTATSIFIAGQDIYVSGFDRDQITEPSVACYWRNGNKTYLSDVYSTAIVILVLGSDVYIGGQEDFKACYWKNGIKTQLSDLTSEVLSIVSSGAHVYLGGYDERSAVDYFVRIGWYLYDGRKHDLFYDNSGNLEHSGDFKSLCLDNFDVYIAGRDNWTSLPIYWKNGSKVELPAPNPYGTYATCISVVDGDIIVGGYYIDTERGVNKACYWRNGQRIDLPGDRATVTAVYVQPDRKSAS